MKKITTIILMIILFSTTINAQNNFNNQWLEVEKLEVDGLPKSALKIVENIYNIADKENNSPQLIKSLFYKSKFALTLEEEAQLKVIKNVKKHISKSTFPTKNVLENILANLYWQYFTQNRYKFYNRTKTGNKVDVSDFRTWDLNTLFKEIHNYFNASLENTEKLQKVEINEFSDILQINKDSKIYRPTLFDFLANNALQFYKSSETTITRPSYKFSINNPIYLSESSTFSKTKITSKDSLSLELNALKVYQKLIGFHKKENNKNALVEIDIQRLNFIYQQAIFKNKESSLQTTLKTSRNLIRNHVSSGLYAFEIAQFQKNKANNKKALLICNEIIKQFPKSLGEKKCSILKKQITQKTLSIIAEKYIPVDKYSRLLINYKNIDNLFFTAYKITQKQQIEFHKIYKFQDKKIHPKIRKNTLLET
ncbi:hypothetical protein [Polaribacter ponticola]|uniref:Alpha-2-macroglobulin n=1 Tax=Polaribacter ponticola TaxID=2978475 RepID=A0ABT5S9H7_9FLAO|nr:hypothetical protein [Polaribacter sp. MSW5]MDD7914766.1 hypothetical protein [Polaribacter sp. MSW5]